MLWLWIEACSGWADHPIGPSTCHNAPSPSARSSPENLTVPIFPYLNSHMRPERIRGILQFAGGMSGLPPSTCRKSPKSELGRITTTVNQDAAKLNRETVLTSAQWLTHSPCSQVDALEQNAFDSLHVVRPSRTLSHLSTTSLQRSFRSSGTVAGQKTD